MVREVTEAPHHLGGGGEGWGQDEGVRRVPTFCEGLTWKGVWECARSPIMQGDGMNMGELA